MISTSYRINIELGKSKIFYKTDILLNRKYQSTSLYNQLSICHCSRHNVSEI